jgi:hypothetical protein
MNEEQPQLLCINDILDCSFTKGYNVTESKNQRYWMAPIRNGLVENSLQTLLPKTCTLPFFNEKSFEISFFQRFEERAASTSCFRKLLIDCTACHFCKKEQFCPVHYDSKK